MHVLRPSAPRMRTRGRPQLFQQVCRPTRSDDQSPALLEGRSQPQKCRAPRRLLLLWPWWPPDQRLSLSQLS